MDRKAFGAAKEKLQVANKTAIAMREATDVAMLARLWEEFLRVCPETSCRIA